MPALLAPVARQQFFVNGVPAANHKLYTYLANTTTPQATYTNRAGTVPHSNPIVLDADGRTPQGLYLTPGIVYDFVFKTAADVTVWTQEDVTADAGDASAVFFTQSGAGAVPRPLQEKAAESVSVADYTTLANALAAIPAGGGELIATPGTINVTANTTIPKNVTLKASDGAMFNVAAGVTLTVLGEVAAGNHEIFDGAGTVDLDNSASEYNLAWFKTANGYINERWDFARRGMLTFRTKVVRIPRPREGQAGVLKSGNRLFWLFNAPLTFQDAQNASTWYIEGEFQSVGSCASFMLFDDAAKPENIYFYGPIQVNIPAAHVVPVGIDFRAASRVSFFGNIAINGADTTIAFGGPSQTGAVGDIWMPRVQASFFSVAAVDIYGKAVHTTQSVHIGNLQATAAQVAGLPVARLRGLLRDIKIDSVYYATDTPKDGYLAVDAEDVVLVESNAEGDIRHCEIGAIYQATANNGLRVQSAVANASLIAGLKVGRIFSKFNASAANIDYCSQCTIEDVENTGTITVGANASHTSIRSGSALKNVIDSGTSTLINGMGKQTRGGGLPPAPAVAWPLGAVIRETSDNRLYIRIANDNAATDFIMIRGALRGTTANRPVLTATDVAVMYMDTTLDADGKPIWWTGTTWVDATGAAV